MSSDEASKIIEKAMQDAQRANAKGMSEAGSQKGEIQTDFSPNLKPILSQDELKKSNKTLEDLKAERMELKAKASDVQRDKILKQGWGEEKQVKKKEENSDFANMNFDQISKDVADHNLSGKMDSEIQDILGSGPLEKVKPEKIGDAVNDVTVDMDEQKAAVAAALNKKQKKDEPKVPKIEEPRKEFKKKETLVKDFERKDAHPEKDTRDTIQIQINTDGTTENTEVLLNGRKIDNLDEFTFSLNHQKAKVLCKLAKKKVIQIF